MGSDLATLRAVFEEVEKFYVRDRTLRKAQQHIKALIEKNASIDDADAGAYLREVRRYFAAFEKEAREHLRSVDRRLAHVSQVQFNLTAERGVTARRVEATQGVLGLLANLDDR